MPTVPTSTASTDPEVVTTSIEPAPAGSTEAPASTGHTPTTHPPTGEFPRLDFPGFLEWIGRSTVPVPEGEYDLGSTGSVNWTLHVSPERVCLHQSAPFGGNCTGVDDGSLPAGSFVKRGGTDAHDGRWTRFQVAPIGVDIRFVIGDVAACDMHALAVPAPSDLVVWACEGSGDTPQPLDVVATRDGEAVQSPMS